MLETKQIKFGGVTVPAYIAKAPQYVSPARKMTVTPIAGSNREHVDMQNAWENYDQPYTLFVYDDGLTTLPEKLMSVAEKLYLNDYQELKDDYTTDYYRLAYFKGPFDIENRRTVLGKFDVTFRCRPEWFLNTGKNPVVFTTGGNIVNPTSFIAKPQIKVEGSGSGTITVAGTTVEFTDLVDYVIVDSDKEDCYRLPTENRNSLMTGSFPLLPAGTSAVSFTGGITKVTVTPNWYKII